MANGFKHSPDLAVSPFVNGDKHDGIKGLITNKTHIGGTCQASVKIHTLTKLAQFFFCYFIGNFAQVLLGNFMTGMEKMLHHVTIVCQKDQALTVKIQTPDRI